MLDHLEDLNNGHPADLDAFLATFLPATERTSDHARVAWPKAQRPRDTFRHFNGEF